MMSSRYRITIAQFEGIDNTPALPLAAGLLVATAKQNPLLAKHVLFDIIVPRAPISETVSLLSNSQMVGFSLYPWNYAYSFAVIEALHAHHPEIVIVLGGPSLPKKEEAVLAFLEKHRCIDVMILGEGEYTFSEFLETYLTTKDLEGVPAIAYRKEGKPVQNSVARRVQDFDRTGSPYLDGTFTDLLQKYPGFFQMGVLETNRGCPFLCTFCDWSLTPKVMEYPLERICQEIDWLVEQEFSNLCIIDANFGIRKRDIHISNYLAQKKRESGRPGFCYFYLTKNNHQKNWQTIQIFNEVGIHCCVGLAVQDFDEEVLKAVRRDNIQSMETIQLREICAEQGIPTRNELILGLPKQTYQSFVHTLLRAMPPHPKHDFIIFLCRLLENTELANPEQQEEHRIQTRRCLWVSPKGMEHGVVPEYQDIIVATADMPQEEWVRTYHFAHLASMAYNKYFLRHIFHAWEMVWNRSLQELLETLHAAIYNAPLGSVFYQLQQTLMRYSDSILSEGAFLLPILDVSDRPWELDEALGIVVLRNTKNFYEEVHKTLISLLPTKEHAQFRELMQYQESCIPQQHLRVSTKNFQWNWSLLERGKSVQKKKVSLGFQPPLYCMIPDSNMFIDIYLNLMQSRSITTQHAQQIMVDVQEQ